MRNKLAFLFFLSVFTSCILSCDNQTAPSAPSKSKLPTDRLVVAKRDKVMNQDGSHIADENDSTSDLLDNLDDETDGPNIKSRRGKKSIQRDHIDKQNKKSNRFKGTFGSLAGKVKGSGIKFKDALDKSTKSLKTKFVAKNPEEQVRKNNKQINKLSPDSPTEGPISPTNTGKHATTLGQRNKSQDASYIANKEGKNKLATRSSTSIQTSKRDATEWRNFPSVPTRIRPSTASSAPTLEELYASGSREWMTDRGSTMGVGDYAGAALPPSSMSGIVGSSLPINENILEDLSEEKENEETDEFESDAEDTNDDTVSSRSSKNLNQETDEELINEKDDKVVKKTSKDKEGVVKKFVDRFRSAGSWLLNKNKNKE